MTRARFTFTITMLNVSKNKNLFTWVEYFSLFFVAQS